MSWSVVQEAVRQAVITCTGMEDYLGADGVTYVRKVEWSNRPTAHRWVQNGFVDLDLGVVTNVHTDETRYEFIEGATPALSRLVPTTMGHRNFSVTVKVCVDNQDPSAAAPTTLCGRLRTRLRRESVLGALQEAGVALVSIGSTINADFDVDGRLWSCGILELSLRCSEVDTDTESDGDWINEVSTAEDNALTAPDGTAVPVVLTVTSEG